tara:strand:+ start:133 stop:549 length:417 start_codon:yes stop_codon:yes gene_type:complete
MTDRVTEADLKILKKKAKHNLARASAGADRLTQSDLMFAEQRTKGLSLEALKDLAKGASNKGVGPLNEYMRDAYKLQQKRDEIKSKLKKEDFLVGGQAKIDADGDGKISANDFKLLRAKKKKFGGMAIKGVKENPPIY